MANILIIDDNESDCNTMKTLLEKEGHKISVAMNGKEAIKKVKSQKFDLILLDIIMPKMSGYELLSLFREKMNHQLKIFYVSIIPKDEVDTFNVDGFIQKPFSPSSFLKSVEEGLKRGVKKGG
ncbi:MAG: response regulator [Candidatus Nanoarchaeia archaeon]